MITMVRMMKTHRSNKTVFISFSFFFFMETMKVKENRSKNYARVN